MGFLSKIAGPLASAAGTFFGGPVGGAVASSLVGGAFADKAEGEVSSAQQANNQLQREQFALAQRLTKPRVEGGDLSFEALLQELGLGVDTGAEGFGAIQRQPTAEDVRNEPGFEFARKSGEDALNRVLNARGHRFSPAAAKALTRFNSDFADTRFGATSDRIQRGNQTRFNNLFNVSGLGQNAINSTIGAGQTQANQIGNTNLLAAGARADLEGTRGELFGNALQQGLSSFGPSSANRGGGNSAFVGSGLKVPGFDGFDRSRFNLFGR